jgi:hypothetical protein
VKHIIIITGQHLVSNPRVWKEANVLICAGYKVSIYTTWYSSQKLGQDYNLINSGVNYRASFNMIPSLRKLPVIIYARAIRRLASFIFRYFNISTVYQEVYLPRKQLKEILRNQCDLYICHQEAGLFLGNKLIQCGQKVAFDIEDYYSKDYLNKYRPVTLLKNAEAFAIKNAAFVTCPSESMAKSLQRNYNFGKEISIIYNCFPIEDEMYRRSKKIPNSFLWFSQTIGPGRGIEELLKALNLVDTNTEIHFVGNINDKYKDFVISELKGTNHIIKFVSLLKHHELLDYINNFEVGLALEPSLPLNKDLTISNKILLYLQSKLMVIASKTTGQLELSGSFNDQLLYVDIGDAIDFSGGIKKMLHTPPKMLSNYFDKKYSWEFSATKFISLIDHSV